MMATTKGNREFVAGLARHGTVLGEAKVMGVRRTPAAYEARLLGNKFDVFAITNAAHLR